MSTVFDNIYVRCFVVIIIIAIILLLNYILFYFNFDICLVLKTRKSDGNFDEIYKVAYENFPRHRNLVFIH